MQITLAAAMSINGKITDGTEAARQSWMSPEDGQHFASLRRAYGAIVMGSRTYDAVQPRPEADRLRVVLTRDPQRYRGLAQVGMLEFTNQPIPTLVQSLEARGHDDLLVAGGGEVYRQFLESGLVSDMYLTIEPVVLGQGVDFVDGDAGSLYNNFTLSGTEQLNNQGTLVLHYTARQDTQETAA